MEGAELLIKEIDAANIVLAELDQTLSAAGQKLQAGEFPSAEIEKLVADTRTPLRDFSQTGLYELNQFLAEARVLIAALTRIAANLERDPARYLFGDQQKGFEAK